MRQPGGVAVAIAVVITMLAAGCTAPDDGVGVVGPRGLRARTDRVEVVSGRGVAPEGTRLTLTTRAEGRSRLPEGVVALADPVDVDLAGRQPDAPLTITLRPHEPPADPDAVAVVVMDDDGRTLDVLAARWDPASGRVVATADHLSLFAFVQVDLDAIGRRLRTALDLVAAQADPAEIWASRPDCDGEPLDLEGGRIVLSNVRHTRHLQSPIWRCLGASDESVAVTLHSASPLPWRVRWTGDARRQQPGAVALKDVAVLVGYDAFMRSPEHAEGLLIPQGQLTYHVDPQDLPIGVAVKVDGFTHLVLSLWYAIELLIAIAYPDSPADRVLEMSGAIDCLAGVIDVHAEATRVDLAAFATVVRGTAACATTALQALGTPKQDVGAVGVLMGIVVTAVPLLWGFVEAIVRTWDGSSDLTFSISAQVSDDAPRGSGAATDLTWEQLANRTYTSDMAGDILLRDGRYRDDRHLITLAEQHLVGDIDRDGDSDAVVVLLENDGGSGVFRNLRVLEATDGGLREVDGGFLGDRTGLEDMRVRGDTLTIDLLVHGPQDGQCCPTEPTTVEIDISDLLAAGR